MEKFLELDGMVLLLTGLGELSRNVENIEDVVLILECIQCVREVLNSAPGIEFIVQNRWEETAQQLAKGEASSIRLVDSSQSAIHL
jgi:hypothetical protein